MLCLLPQSMLRTVRAVVISELDLTSLHVVNLHYYVAVQKGQITTLVHPPLFIHLSDMGSLLKNKQGQQTMTKVIWHKVESLWQVHPSPRLYSSGGSIGLTVRQQFAIACFGWGLTTPNLPFPCSSGITI